MRSIHVFCCVLIMGVVVFVPVCIYSGTEARETSDRVAGKSVNPLQRVVVGDGIYGLELRTGRLFLSKEGISEETRYSKDVEVTFTSPPGGVIAEYWLESLGVEHIVAVVKVRVDDRFEFYCLIWNAGSGTSLSSAPKKKSKILSAETDLKILAVGGRSYSGSLFIVLGNVSSEFETKPKTVIEGIFYFNLCPGDASGGATAVFTASSEERKDADR